MDEYANKVKIAIGPLQIAHKLLDKLGIRYISLLKNDVTKAAGYIIEVNAKQTDIFTGYLAYLKLIKSTLDAQIKCQCRDCMASRQMMKRILKDNAGILEACTYVNGWSRDKGVCDGKEEE